MALFLWLEVYFGLTDTGWIISFAFVKDIYILICFSKASLGIYLHHDTSMPSNLCRLMVGQWRPELGFFTSCQHTSLSCTISFQNNILLSPYFISSAFEGLLLCAKWDWRRKRLILQKQKEYGLYTQCYLLNNKKLLLFLLGSNKVKRYLREKGFHCWQWVE